MRVFLDECVDWRLARDIEGHEVKTARRMGWSAIKNGELLALAAGEFDIFVTVDRNLSFQQNIPAFPIAVIVLRARSNRLADLRPLVPKLLSCISGSASSRKNPCSMRLEARKYLYDILRDAVAQWLAQTS